ncbi:MAG TPA: hypothetical protein ENH82_12630 [bacterium]|nr:hypothetical protein [bacterium]
MRFLEKNIGIFVIMNLLLAGIITGCTEKAQKDSTGTTRIGRHGILHKADWTKEIPVIPSEREQKKKEMAERMDVAGLISTGRVVVDKNPAMLNPPENLAQSSSRGYVIAKEPPVVEFAVIPVEPVYLAKSPVESKSDSPNIPGPWSNYTQSTYDTRTGKFYSSVGDHSMYGAHLHIVEYDPAAKKVRCLPEINKVIGRSKYQYSDGKLHGWLDFYQSKHLNSLHLWFCTYWAKYPEPDEEDYATGYVGGHIMSCDVLTGDMVDYGVPLVRASWPYHRVDTKRGILYAVGMFGEFLVWDINEQKTRWAGYLPKGMGWYERAILIDEKTGMVYTTNRDSRSDPELHFIKYDPFKNRFSKLDCHVPPDREPALKGKAGHHTHMRAQTSCRGSDGLFWCITSGGELFTFDPENEVIVDKGLSGPGTRRYTCSMDRSPGGRYLYYVPGDYHEGSPVIQYDTRTDTIKVLAFMFPYYHEKYGYTADSTYSVKLDDKGERLLIIWNGAFVEDAYIHNFRLSSVMVVNIPESERIE